MISNSSPGKLLPYSLYLAKEYGILEAAGYVFYDTMERTIDFSEDALMIVGVGLLGLYEFCAKTREKGIKSAVSDVKGELKRILSDNPVGIECKLDS